MNLCSFSFINFVQKVMDNTMKHIGRILLATLILGTILLQSGCSAQRKQHKAVPCPCEKENRRK